MIIHLNSTALEVPNALNLQTFLINQDYTHSGFATIHNHVFVPRSAYADTFLQDGDTVEIILPMQGG